MSKTKPINVIDGALETMATAALEWKRVNTPAVLKKRVVEALNKEADQIVFKLLGFNTRFGDCYELDHCNGRSGESAAGDYLRKHQADAITAWLSQVPMPVMSQRMKSDLVKEAKDTYLDAVYEAVRQHAKDKADKDVKEILETLSQSTQVDNYVKTLQLLNPEGI